MDPLSIATAAASLSALAFKASKGIYNCIDDIRSSDATLLQLHSEVNALQSGLQNIASTFESDTVVQFCKTNAGSLNQLQSTRLLNNVKPLLVDCQHTLEKLETLIISIEGNSGRKQNLFNKSVKAFKINSEFKLVELIRHEIRSYSSAMQMTLHMVGICITIDGSKQAETIAFGLDEKLKSLAAQITDVQKTLLESDHIRGYEGETIVTDETESRNHVAHLKTYIEAAREVFSNGSIYAGSVDGTIIGNDTDINRMTRVFGSVMGIDEQQRQQINDWRVGETLVEEEDPEDDEGDAERDIFQARLSIARKKLEAKDYKAAETQFSNCLRNKDLVMSLPMHDIIDIKLEYSLACHGSGNFGGEQSMLEEVLQSEIPKAQAFHLQHRLATSYFREGSLAEAQRTASVAMKGRRKLSGPRGQSYLETVKLLADICKAQNNMDDAEVYESLLPDHFAAQEPDRFAARQTVDPRIDPTVDTLDSNKHAAAIRLLSKNGYSLGNKKTFFEALHWASYAKHPQVVRLLLQQGTDIKGADSVGNTMLIYAAEHGYVDLVEQLIKDGADISAKNTNGFTALHRASVKNQVGVTRVLLDKGLDIAAAARDGAQPLHLAAVGGSNAVIDLLLDRGAGMNAGNKTGSRPLHDAIKNGHISTVRLLLRRGADPNALITDSGYTALMLTVDGAERDTGYTEMAKMLLDHGADVNASNKSGWRPLHYAVYFGYVVVARLLLDRGADPNVPLPDSACTALMLAVRAPGIDAVRIEIAELLIKREATVTLKDTKGHTALHFAEAKDNKAMTALLKSPRWRS